MAVSSLGHRRAEPRLKYGLPFLANASGVYVAVTESDLLDWAGMWLQHKPGTAGTMTAALASPLPAAPWPARIQGNRTASGVSDAPPPEGPVQAGFVVARTPHNSPWRVFLVGRHPADLLGTDLVLNLATPNRLGDTSIRLWQDAPDSAEHPEHVAVSEKVVTSSDELSLSLAPSGGMVAILSPQ